MVAKTGRVASGIEGLDELIEGGFLPGSSVLIAGKTGTAKTLFATQFLYHGAKKGEAGIFITTEETPEAMRQHANAFGWEVEKLEDANLFKIVEVEPFGVDTLMPTLEGIIEKMKAKRIVIDSTSMFEMYIDKKLETRKVLFKLLKRLKETGAVVLITTEIPEDSAGLSRYGVIEFAADAVIVLQFMALTKYKRSLLIRKMRDTDHSTDIHPFDITEHGLKVYKV